MNESTLWEYRVISLGTVWRGPSDETVEETLNELGMQGWEVVSVAYDYRSGRVRAVAKRPLTDRARRQRSLPR